MPSVDVLAVPIGAQAPNAGKPLVLGWNALRALLLLGCCVLCACRPEPPEQALRNTIAAMQAAAETQDADALFEPIADDFAGSEGMDRKAFRRYVTLVGFRNRQVGVRLGPLDVKLFEQRASVSFTAALSGGAGWLPEQVQVYDVETGWRLDGNEWQLISARWKPKL